MPHKNKEQSKKYKQDWYAVKRNKLIARVLERRKLVTDYVESVKVEKGCKICLEKHPAVLDFHHISDKLLNVLFYALIVIANIIGRKEIMNQEIKVEKGYKDGSVISYTIVRILKPKIVAVYVSK